ncbi:heme peroxidase-related [Chlorella sorokiniana]|uniref:Heme peroxidase-related n=1 Tax=Chlorella sorokiniana TaxID=3076 RepID=A0A2P6TFC3_CHLSO|nr:heme peroxidase-related [Chlorella sorokiniana]|eukprot:PRW32669.1 heme peroxidase-related [Chlorella sorokiniana]
MERLLERRPLLPAEHQAPPATVCVTGAAGFIGSRIVARLLAAGHTVHATRRAAGDDAPTIAALQELPGAAERLRWFEANLTREGSFDAAVGGCRYVIHTAGVVDVSAPPSKGYERVIKPTLLGIANVLGAVNRSPSVEKVVLTSSMAAMSADFAEADKGHVYSEKDWNLAFPRETKDAYFAAKAVAEMQAWSIAGQQDRWRLVAICPATVYGPLLARSPGMGSTPALKKLLDGSFWPFVAPLGLGTVDIDDVAAAHCLAMVQPEASGRYVLWERACLMTEVAAILREEFPAYCVPPLSAPLWLSVPVLILSRTLNYRWIKRMWKRKARVDSSRALKELGLGQFIPLRQTLKDLFSRLIELGILKRMPAGSSKSKKERPAVAAIPAAAASLPATTPSAGAAGAAVVGAAKATVEAVAPSSGGSKKAA